MSVWFTSDTHFNHRAMVEKQWRPQYKTIAEMNEDLITRWNRIVQPPDVVWHLGDWGLGDPFQHLPIVRRLNGTIHLVTGNHDRPWPGQRDSYRWQPTFLSAGFASVQTYARRRVLGQNVFLSHFPYRGDHLDRDFSQYALADQGHFLLHGHVHTEWTERDRMINVGVDVRDFQPVSLEQVIAIMEAHGGS